MNVRFTCPSCEQPGRLETPLPAEWVCPACDQVLHLKPGADPLRLLVCGNAELYRKKDFPQNLGMAILGLSCLASTLTYWWYQKWWTWGILIGSALFDAILYVLVGDAVVCYRCDAALPRPAARFGAQAVRADYLRALPAGADAAKTTGAAALTPPPENPAMVRFAVLLAALLAAFAVGRAAAPADGPGRDAPPKRIVGYFTEWGIYDRKYNVADIPADKLTHVNYAFAKIDDNGECTVCDPFAAVEKAYPGDAPRPAGCAETSTSCKS